MYVKTNTKEFFNKNYIPFTCNYAMTNALGRRPVRAKTMKLMSYPDLTSEQVNRLAVAWIEDRRTDFAMDTDDFHIVPSKG